VLLFTPVFTHFPPVAPFAARLIGPLMLERLGWPILLAALLTLGWMIWELLEYSGSLLGKLGMPTRVAPFLPAIVVGALMIGFAPATTAEIRSLSTLGEIQEEKYSCTDPTFSWMQDIVKTSSIVLAPVKENLCIPAYTAAANVIGPRGTTTPDMQRFFGAMTLDGEMITAVIDESMAAGAVTMDAASLEVMHELRDFMFENVYMSRAQVEHQRGAIEVIRALVDHLLSHPDELPDSFRTSDGELIVRVTDYVAGMTDRFALALHDRHFRPAV
jgi:hypothetical protein